MTSGPLCPSCLVSRTGAEELSSKEVLKRMEAGYRALLASPPVTFGTRRVPGRKSPQIVKRSLCES